MKVSIEEIINEFISYNDNDAEADQIRKAYLIAEQAHKGQERKSLEPYIVHPLSVAKILVKLKQDWEIICAALLHDTVEDTDLSLKDIRDAFGNGVSELVWALTKIKAETIKHIRAEHQAKIETIRKIVVGTTEDPRVIIIKLADRLDNMRTLKHIDDVSKRKKIASETMSIYAPFADRLGLSDIKRELQNLSFRHLKPREYQKFYRRLALQKSFLKKDIQNVNDLISVALKKSKVVYKVHKRFKTPFSLYQREKQKLRPHTVVFEIVTDERVTCYQILGIIHSILPPTPKSLVNDFIAIPRSNGYQALHTQILFNEYVYPIHIFTKAMYEVSKFGIIAGSEQRSKQIYANWLELLKDLVTSDSDSQYFMTGVKEITQQNHIYVCTPKGDYWAFPLNSVVLDFAYHIHTDIGHRCAGAIFDDHQTVGPYDELRDGTIVQILTSPNVKPRPEWLTKAKTPRAHNAIKNWLDNEKRVRSIEFGKKMLQQDMLRYQLDFETIVLSEEFEKLIVLKGASNQSDFFSKIGKGSISVREITSRFIPPGKRKKFLQKEKRIWARLFPSSALKKIDNRTILITDPNSAFIKMSKCCNPSPGDDAIAIISRKHGQLSIHKTDCVRLKHHPIDKDRTFKVKWGENIPNKVSATFFIRYIGNIQPFKEIIVVFQKNEIKTTKIKMAKMNRWSQVEIHFSVFSKEKIDELKKQIESIQGIQKVEKH